IGAGTDGRVPGTYRGRLIGGGAGRPRPFVLAGFRIGQFSARIMLVPQNRPRIPAAIERQVLIDAGHRCAVCGIELPLELAHIIPWSRSKEHSADNLLCLCANCHSRADAEKWGEATLREYKQRPWVLRWRTQEGASGNGSGVSLPHKKARNREAPVGFDVFLSHNSKDKTTVRKLAEALTQLPRFAR